MRRIAFAVIAVLFGCTGNDITSAVADPPLIKSISIYGPAEVEQGQWVAFTVNVIDMSNTPLRNPAVNWSTSDPSVATINQAGQLRGESEGTVTVTVSAGDKESKSTLKVTPWVCRAGWWDDC